MIAQGRLQDVAQIWTGSVAAQRLLERVKGMLARQHGVAYEQRPPFLGLSTTPNWVDGARDLGEKPFFTARNPP